MLFNKVVNVLLLLVLIMCVFVVAGCAGERQGQWQHDASLPPSPVEQILPEDRNVYDRVLIGARQEVEKGVTYDDAYQVIDYPGGDVAPDRGACTDVVVRAFRNAGMDLQELIHEDMKANFNAYPQNWALNQPDPNIDHRRVPNQMKFFDRYAQSLTLAVENQDLSSWHWGDVVYWKFANGLEHCGIISDRKNSRGVPLVIHNAGAACEEDCLTRWEIIGHYRYPAQ